MTWVIVEWAATVTSFLGTFGIARSWHTGWLLGVAADFGFVAFGIRKKLWGFTSLCFGYLLINFYGWLQ